MKFKFVVSENNLTTKNKFHSLSRLYYMFDRNIELNNLSNLSKNFLTKIIDLEVNEYFKQVKFEKGKRIYEIEEMHSIEYFLFNNMIITKLDDIKYEFKKNMFFYDQINGISEISKNFQKLNMKLEKDIEEKRSKDIIKKNLSYYEKNIIEYIKQNYFIINNVIYKRLPLFLITKSDKNEYYLIDNYSKLYNFSINDINSFTENILKLKSSNKSLNDNKELKKYFEIQEKKINFLNILNFITYSQEFSFDFDEKYIENYQKLYFLYKKYQQDFHGLSAENIECNFKKSLEFMKDTFYTEILEQSYIYLNELLPYYKGTDYENCFNGTRSSSNFSVILSKLNHSLEEWKNKEINYSSESFSFKI